MQKILRRSALAEAQAVRRRVKRRDYDLRMKRKNQRENDNYKLRLVNANIVQERKNRREDYELGPLAPRRDVGSQKETYGTVSQWAMTGPKLTWEQRKEMYPDTALRYLNIRVDDRVVLLQGRDKGKIGKVLQIDRMKMEVVVEGLNLVRLDCALSTPWDWS
jgi:large subunit ribosomal protein L24